MLDSTTEIKEAHLYRMEMSDHVCPFGLKAKDALQREGYHIVDHRLTSREEVDAFKKENGVKTTPQIFIADKRVGGYEDLLKFLGKKVQSKDQKTYKPVIVLFSVAACLAVAVTYLVSGTFASSGTVPYFISISMVLLGMQKLADLEAFATMFLNYDLLAQRWVRYGYIYPFAEAGAGILMLAGVLTIVSAPVALFVSSIGAVSVFKAVYIDRRELLCACVGGNTKVPLGFISLTENLMMMGMAIWMLTKLL